MAYEWTPSLEARCCRCGCSFVVKKRLNKLRTCAGCRATQRNAERKAARIEHQAKATVPRFINYCGEAIDMVVLKASLLYCIPPKRSDRDCPFCGRETTVGEGDSRSYGFRTKAHATHVFKCYNQSLNSMGLQMGKYHGSYMLHRAEPFTDGGFGAGR